MKRIAITGAAGQITYSLLFRLANGDLFGKDEPIALHLLELPRTMNALEGVIMELKDCAFPLLQEIVFGCDAKEVFKGVDYAFLVGARPRGPGMERKDLLNENAKIFVEQGEALNVAAKKGVKVLVVGNPCNTNCLIASKHAPNISPHNFFSMTRLDQNRATFLLAEKANVSIKDVSHVTIWGNHSSTLVSDFVNARIKDRPLTEVIKDNNWLENDFFTANQQRGAKVIAKRGLSSAASAANAAIDAMKSITVPTSEGEWYSVGIFSEGNPYGIDENLIFSFPCRTKNDGTVEIVKGLDWNDFLRQKIAITENELKEERILVKELL